MTAKLGDVIGTCDRCGQPLLFGQTFYSVAWKPEKKTGRHWDCHTPIEEALGQLKNMLRNRGRP